MAEPRPRPPGSEEDLTQWQFVESDRPFVTKFPDQHRVALPGEPFVVLNESGGQGLNRFKGRRMVVSFSLPLNALLHRALSGPSGEDARGTGAADRTVGCVVLPEVRMEGYSTRQGALGNKSCFVFAGAGEGEAVKAASSASSSGCLFVLCQYRISEPRTQAWFDALLDAFEPASLGIVEDVPESNLKFVLPGSGSGDSEPGGDLQVFASSASAPLSRGCAAVRPELADDLCSQIACDLPQLLASQTRPSLMPSDCYAVAVVRRGRSQHQGWAAASVRALGEVVRPLLEQAAGEEMAPDAMGACADGAGEALRRYMAEHGPSPSSMSSIYV